MRNRCLIELSRSPTHTKRALVLYTNNLLVYKNLRDGASRAHEFFQEIIGWIKLRILGLVSGAHRASEFGGISEWVILRNADIIASCSQMSQIIFPLPRWVSLGLFDQIPLIISRHVD